MSQFKKYLEMIQETKNYITESSGSLTFQEIDKIKDQVRKIEEKKGVVTTFPQGGFSREYMTVKTLPNGASYNLERSSDLVKYCSRVLDGLRYVDQENVFFKDDDNMNFSSAWDYFTVVINKEDQVKNGTCTPWGTLEANILYKSRGEYFTSYAKAISKSLLPNGRWQRAEEKLLSGSAENNESRWPEYVYNYIEEVIKGPWPEGEHKLVEDDSRYAYRYVVKILKDNKDRVDFVKKYKKQIHPKTLEAILKEFNDKDKEEILK